jgi:hypothetical protein
LPGLTLGWSGGAWCRKGTKWCDEDKNIEYKNNTRKSEKRKKKEKNRNRNKKQDT